MSAKKKKNAIAQRARPVDLSSHWVNLFIGLRYSSQEFYARVEQVLAEREVPDITITRVDWMEGGALSARREYLRIQRERLVFDICGAPFGTGFFVSIWSGERPLRIGVPVLFLALIVFFALLDLIAKPDFGLAAWLDREYGLGRDVPAVL